MLLVTPNIFCYWPLNTILPDRKLYYLNFVFDLTKKLQFSGGALGLLPTI